MTSLQIEIDPTNIFLGIDLIEYGGSPPSFRQPGEIIPSVYGAVLLFEGGYPRRTVYEPSTLQFSLFHLDPTAVTLFAGWLYEKLKDKADELRVNEEIIQISAEAIECMLEKHLNS